jgi:hypothetical protein
MINVTGIAKANKLVGMVEASVDNGANFTPAVLTQVSTSPLLGSSSSYTVAVTPLVGGNNTILVRAIDWRGNVSAVASHNIVVMRPLAVKSMGAGSVTKGFDPSSFREIGKSYSLTATPSSGAVFEGWTVNDATNTGITAAKQELPGLTFIFQEGLELTANFISNPFIAVAGGYNGLVKPHPSLPAPIGTLPSTSTEGLFTAIVTSSGTFTGKLSLDGFVLGLVGSFDIGGTARFGANRTTTVSVPRPNKPSLVVGLQLDVTSPGGTDKLTGVVTQNNRSTVTAVSNINADRAYYNGTSRIPVGYVVPGTNANGVFTAVFLAKDLSFQPAGYTKADYPQGDGYATITVTKAGVVALTGALADGKALTASAPLSKNNQWPLFVQLYDNRGAISGQVSLDGTSTDSDISAAGVRWFRPFMDVQHYPFGWPEGVRVELLAARYIATPAQSVLPNLVTPSGLAHLDFSDGLLAAPLSKRVSISTADLVSKVPLTDTSFTMSLMRASGRVNGTFTHGDGTKPAFHGIIYQKGIHAGGYGYFLSTTPKVKNYKGESGVVRLLAE